LKAHNGRFQLKWMQGHRGSGKSSLNSSLCRRSFMNLLQCAKYRRYA
jgi:hypothetical protein